MIDVKKTTGDNNWGYGSNNYGGSSSKVPHHHNSTTQGVEETTVQVYMDNDTYLKLFWGRSNHHKPCLLSTKAKVIPVTTTVVIVLFCFIATFYVFQGWNASPVVGVSIPISTIYTRLPQDEELPLRCTKGKHETQICSGDYPTSHNPTNPSRPLNQLACPSYFRWIHEDLRPWREKGITRDMLEGARRTAHFRLVILDGKVYVEKYRQSIQSRDMFTLWGILQLLRWYPGRLPDLELMFDCDDRPVIPLDKFRGPNAAPAPLFRYCSDQWSLDIVFPDWSFWGW